MRRFVSIACLSAVALLSAGADAPKPEPETVSATRRLTIIEGMTKLNSSDVSDVAAAAAIKVMKADIAAAHFAIDDFNLRQLVGTGVNIVVTANGGQNLSMKISVNLNSVPELHPKRAAAAADAAVEAVCQLYRAGDRVPRDRFELATEQLRRQHEELAARLADAEAQQQKVTLVLRDQSGLADASPEGVRTIAQKLSAEYETAQLDLKAKTARREALAEAIAKLTADAANKAKDDPVASELEQVVKIREREVAIKQQMMKSGTVTEAEVNASMGAIAEARARLLERQMTAAAGNGGDTAAAWNRDLMSLSVDLAEIRARADALEKRLAQVSAALSRLDRQPSVLSSQSRLEVMSRQLSEIDKRMSEMSIQLHSESETSVSVIESVDEPATATTAPAP